MITLITLNRNKASFKRNGVKFIAKLTNLDARYVFKREFINGFSKELYGNCILEVAFTDNDDRKYFAIDPWQDRVEEVDYERIKKDAKADPAEFCKKYFR